MEVKLEIPKYSIETGFKSEWEFGFEIEIKSIEGAINLIANKEGLISLAKQLLTLAEDEVPRGYHLHFDENNSLEEGSLELIIKKG